MAAVAHGAAQHMGHQDVDQYAGDVHELQNAVAGIVGLLTSIQARVATDHRKITAERAVLEIERASARQDRERAEKAVRAAERAAEALELEAARLRGTRSEGRPTMEVASYVLEARASPMACELKKEDVPPIPRRAPPLKGSVAADSPRPPPEKLEISSMESAPSKAGTLYKEPPMPKKAVAVANSAGATISQARYKEPPMRKAPQPTVQIAQVLSSASPQRSEPTATNMESVAHRDFEDEFDDATRWAEASAPPSKAPPADSPYYRVMPAPKKTPELEHDISLPPGSANLTGEDRSTSSVVALARSKSAPSQPDAASEQAAAKSSRYKAPPAEWVRNGSVPAVPREESEASSVTGSVTSLRQGSRVKAPPMRPAAPTRPPPAARK